jgi:DNA (cytosine-5)-methyltransferase 1
MQKLRLLSLFAGIGGFDIGAEMTGRFETVAFCEINPFARAVLAKHWPNVPCFPDVTKLTKDQINGPIDAICAGFPCQDLSFAGKGAGIEGARSGLWSEVIRLVGEIRPAIVMLENVPAIIVRGLGRVLSDLAKIGYNAFWDCIRASDLGAWHRRDRWFLVAYPQSKRGRQGRSEKSVFWLQDLQVKSPRGFERWPGRSGIPTPYLCGAADGVPNRTHRLTALGNAIVPLWAFLVCKVAIAIYDQMEENYEV